MANENRITAPKVYIELHEHLQRHTDKMDPKLHNVYEAVFGEKGKGGLYDEVERLRIMDSRLEKIETGINRVLWVMGLAVLGALLKLVILG